MSESSLAASLTGSLSGSGLPTAELEAFAAAGAAAREATTARPSFEAAAARLSRYLELGAGLLGRLPARPAPHSR
jgi:hypothetical protein